MFSKAKAIFLKGLTREMNITGVFTCELPALDAPARLRVAGSSFYRVYFNEELLIAGPARAAHGHARVDELTLDLRRGGTLRVDVASYYLKAHSQVRQPGFLTAEVTADGRVLAATGYDFAAFRNLSRVQKVMRFSLQRHFSEVYRGVDDLVPCETECVETDVKYIPREAPVPCMDVIDAKMIAGMGSFAKTREYTRDPWYIRRIPEQAEGFAGGQLEAAPYREYRPLTFTPSGDEPRAFEPIEIGAGRYVMCDFERVYTGFIQAEIDVFEDTELIVAHEDICAKPFVDSDRLNPQYMHVISYELKPGSYRLENFDPIEMRYVQFNVLRGSIRLNRAGLRQFIYPALKNGVLNSGDETLDAIYDAAASTFRQNSLDIYMDCPTRERAGWLCDSYYTAQAEYEFTGDNALERPFLRNFVNAGQLDALPEGMIPMCYPSEPTGSFIPQWAMWYVLELEQALERSAELKKEEFRPLCEGLLGFFEKYLNEDGLLEGLPGWNFVEWSRCNDWTGGVSYPTNFLYSRMLEIIGRLYDREELLRQSARIRKTAVHRSFDGAFFTDNAVRNEAGVLVNTGNTSETCQYYAVRFAGIDLDAPEYAVLKRAFEDVFGPDREKYSELGRDIEPSTPFIGIYLRIECLLARGMYEKALEEIRDFFGGMANLTGTLWEHKTPESGSLNHGFASYAAAAIQTALRKMNA